MILCRDLGVTHYAALCATALATVYRASGAQIAQDKMMSPEERQKLVHHVKM